MSPSQSGGRLPGFFICCIDYAPAKRQDGVLGKHGEGKHHLVDLAVAVSAYRQNAALQGIEHGDDSRRVVFVGEPVARSVIKYVAEQKQTQSAVFALML